MSLPWFMLASVGSRVSLLRLPPWIVFAASVFLSLLAFHYARQAVDESARLRFERRVADTVAAIRERMGDYEQILRGARALFSASRSVERREWRDYVEALRVQIKFPGIQGVGYTEHIAAAQLDTHVAAIRAEGFPDYLVWPAGVRPEYAPVLYLEPFTGRNLRAFGYDMFSEPVRRAAMELARDTGQPALSGQVRLVQETDQDVQAGTLMYLPVYRHGRPLATLAQRRDALQGFVYAPFRMGDLMRRILEPTLDDLGLSLYDGPDARPEDLLYEHRPADIRTGAGYRPAYSDSVLLDMAGRQWSLHFATTPVFDAAMASRQPMVILAGGLTISLLLFGITWSLSARARALALANGMTEALRDSESRTSAIVESTLDGIVTVGDGGSILSFNRAAESIFGYAAAAVIGRDVGVLMPEREARQHGNYLRRLLGDDAPKLIGTRRQVTGQRGDGSTFPLELAVTEMRVGGQRQFIGLLRDISDRVRTEHELVEREQRFRTLAALAPVGIFQCDAQGKCSYVNARWCELAGMTPHEANGVDWLKALHPEDAHRVAAEWAAAVQGGTEFRAEYRLIGNDRQMRWIAARAEPIRDETGETGHFIGTADDITGRKETEATRELARQAEARAAHLGRILESTFNEIYLIDAQTYRFLHVNQHACRNLGYSLEELLQMTPLDVKRNYSAEQFARMLEPLLRGEVEILTFEAEHWRKDGSIYPVEVRIRISEYEGRTAFVAIINDTSERKRNEDYVRHLALHDALTGLPNRSLLQDRLLGAIERAKREHGRVALLFIDLDRFKTINDSLGHHVGDEVIKTIAARLADCVRATDTVARMGGDEFVVVLPDLHQDDSPVPLVEKTLAAIAAPVNVGTHELLVTTSVGVSIYPDDGGDVATLMKNADMAMYCAKENGRNHFRLFDSRMHSSVVHKLAMENDLRRALERGEYMLHYQPRVDCRTRQVIGAEALLRLRHPQRGVVLPGEFIDLAEETGLIVRIGEWVLREACTCAKNWSRDTGQRIRVAVNVSPRQLFAAGTLVECVERTLKETGLDPECLEIEITENVLLQSAEETGVILARLHNLGVLLAIDDFGTGYSNLAYLKRLPIDTLKIDQSFVRDLPADADDAAIASTIIAMAHALKMRVVAEGVETAEQYEFLLSRQCEEAQGYYFGYPATFDKLSLRHGEFADSVPASSRL